MENTDPSRACRSSARKRPRDVRLLPVDSLPIAVEVYDDRDRFLFCNGLFRELFPECRDLLIPGTSREAIAMAKAKRERPSASVGDRNASSVRSVRQHLDGRCFLYLESEATEGLRIGAHFDVSDLAGEAAQLRRRADFDTASGLSNREGFLARCRAEMTRCRRSGAAMCLVFLDIDRFKTINDRFGHLAGDAVITAVGRILAGSSRGSDFGGRIGGDEFAMALPDTPLEGAVKLADRVRLRISARRVVRANVRIAFTASFGVAQLEEHDSAVEDLLERADKRLYEAKQRGRNCVAPVLARSTRSVRGSPDGEDGGSRSA